MNVLVDTSVWSEALRKPPKPASSNIVHELREIIQEGRVIILGAIRQEILSGIRNHSQFVRLKEHMGAFEDHPILREDYELAAELFNHYRSRGIQGTNTDFLICAVSIRSQLAIFSTDKDFGLFSKYVKIHLHEIRSA